MTEMSLLQSVEKHGFLLLQGEEAQDVHAQIRAEKFGKLLPQDKEGTKIYDVKRQNGVENSASSKGSLDIAPHTDGALTDNPPRFVGLYGQTIPDGEQCRTHICNVSDVFNSLTPDERTILKLPDPSKGIFKYTFQLAVYDIFWISEKQLEKSRNELTEEKKAAIRSMTNAFQRFGTSIFINQGSLLLADNRNTLHCRDIVTSPERHLLRYWMADQDPAHQHN